MTWMNRRLLLALAGSLLLHALPLASDLLRPAPAPRRPPPLEARLLPPPIPEQPILLPPEQPEPADSEPPPEPPKPERPHPAEKKPQPSVAQAGWEAAVKKQLRALEKRGELYPGEAIAQGLEGTAEVLFVLDETGKVVAARLERSSGYKILDEAAVRAIYTVHSLPAEAPREAIYPVRFQLH